MRGEGVFDGAGEWRSAWDVHRSSVGLLLKRQDLDRFFKSGRVIAWGSMGNMASAQFLPISRHAKCKFHLQTTHVNEMRDTNLYRHTQLLYEGRAKSSIRLLECDGDHRVLIKSKHVTTLVKEILAPAWSTSIYILDE